MNSFAATLLLALSLSSSTAFQPALSRPQTSTVLFAELAIGGVPAAPTKTTEIAPEPEETAVEEGGDQVVQIMAQQKEIEESFDNEEADDFWSKCYQVTDKFDVDIVHPFKNILLSKTI